MTWLRWLGDNWFTGLQSLAILAGFIFTAMTLRRDERSRRVANLLKVTEQHRNLWMQLFDRPALRRVLEPRPNLTRDPISEDEKLFVGLLILHLNSAYQAIRKGLMEAPEGMDADIRDFFTHPIPREIWKSMRRLQDSDFVAFVESYTSNANYRETTG